jgi:hypothetical protein
MESNPAPDSQNPYLLFFRNTGPEMYQHMSAEQRQKIVTQWNAWFEGLVAEGKALEGQPLQPSTRVISGAGGARVIDGPFVEAKEAIAGYVKLLVKDLDEATAIAKNHPALAHGMIIEVREMTPDCHLGVVTRPLSPAPAASITSH